jgi:glutamate/tyrosine decarboxylase-like PLP-dependent enzyme
VNDRRHLLETFHRSPEYYRDVLPEDEPLHWYQYSIEGTRRFRALKLWLSWKHLGTAGFARLIEHNVDLARYLAERCLEEGFEVIEPELSVVCFRHVPSGLADAEVHAHQNRLQRALEESGEGWVSTTTLRGRTYLRAGVVNYLSTEEDADRLVDALLRFARSV